MSGTYADDLDPRAAALADRFRQRLWQPASTLDASWIRIVIFGIFAYKLLSRDFSIFGYAPAAVLDLYPAELFSPRDDFLMLGFKPIVDLVTFHWVHWFLPIPSSTMLSLIQQIVIGLCLLTLLFGRGPRAVLAVSTFLGLTYLFGYLWRVGHDVDAVFVPLQIALIYCLSQHQEWTLFSRPSEARSSDAGWFKSMTVLCFVGYYFLSGLNKVTDLSLNQWFAYHITDIIKDLADQIAAGSHSYAPSFFTALSGFPWLGLVIVPAVYLSHLAIPIIFFKRRYIAGFFVFYIGFHFVSFGVGILFFALILTWLALIPVHRLHADIDVQIDPSRSGLQRIAAFLVRMPSPSRIRIRPLEARKTASVLLIAAEPGDDSTFENFRGWRRLAWAVPLLWPVLPLLYIPGVSVLADAALHLKPSALSFK